MRAKKLRTKVVGLVAAVMVVGAPLTAWAICPALFYTFLQRKGRML